MKDLIEISGKSIGELMVNINQYSLGNKHKPEVLWETYRVEPIIEVEEKDGVTYEIHRTKYSVLMIWTKING